MILQYGELSEKIGYMESDVIVFTKVDIQDAAEKVKEAFENLKNLGVFPDFVSNEDYLLNKLQAKFEEKIISLDFIGDKKAIKGITNAMVLIDRTDKGKKATAYAFSEGYPVYILNSKGKTIKRIS